MMPCTSGRVSGFEFRCNSPHRIIYNFLHMKCTFYRHIIMYVLVTKNALFKYILHRFGIGILTLKRGIRQKFVPRPVRVNKHCRALTTQRGVVVPEPPLLFIDRVKRSFMNLFCQLPQYQFVVIAEHFSLSNLSNRYLTSRSQEQSESASSAAEAASAVYPSAPIESQKF